MQDVRVAAVQMDSPVAEKERNLDAVARLAKQAADLGARIALFHEGLLVDYPDDPRPVAEPVPEGPSTRRLIEIAKDCDIWLGVGMAESENGRLYITHVFCGPEGFAAKYREIRNEIKWYNVGNGPEPFQIAGLRATCLICADGNSERAWQQAAETDPQIVFWPNNRHRFRYGWLEVIDRAAQLGRPLVATNRVGRSGTGICDGGAIIVGADGHILAHCRHPGQEEIVVADVPIA
jgi:N-carbamoylputrescine amidase